MIHTMNIFTYEAVYPCRLMNGEDRAQPSRYVTEVAMGVATYTCGGIL